MNKWLGVGHIYHTPAVHYQGTPRQVWRATLVTSRGDVSLNSEELDFHTLVAFGDNARRAALKYQKGDVIQVEGELRYHSEPGEGNKKRRTVQIVVTQIDLVSRTADVLPDEIPF